MTGSGLGNFGLGNMGIYGQQPWQEEARRRLYNQQYWRGLQAQGVTDMRTATRQQSVAAQNYASSFLPSGATLGGGVISGSGMPSDGTRLGSNWQSISAPRFPSIFSPRLPMI